MGYMRRKHSLYVYANRMTMIASNLANTILFRKRQVITTVCKLKNAWIDNERIAMREIQNTYFLLDSAWGYPQAGKSMLFYNCLDDVMKTTVNPDYFVEGLHRQSV